MIPLPRWLILSGVALAVVLGAAGVVTAAGVVWWVRHDAARADRLQIEQAHRDSVTDARITAIAATDRAVQPIIVRAGETRVVARAALAAASAAPLDTAKQASARRACGAAITSDSLALVSACDVKVARRDSAIAALRASLATAEQRATLPPSRFRVTAAAGYELPLLGTPAPAARVDASLHLFGPLGLTASATRRLAGADTTRFFAGGSWTF